ncbi:hypothetical protein [Streptomyces sp. DG1A-41]|uniref:hypothetical protein n=1 Tax=Streptomyces sp. DG1A-41 TaxID=3125779 RepID=UPI0030CC76E2
MLSSVSRAERDFGTDAWYTFSAVKAGPYTVPYVDEDRSAGAVRVYDAGGRAVCESGTDPCRIREAGTCTAVLGTKVFSPSRDRLVVFDRASDAGCVAMKIGRCKGKLSTVGQYDCLTLPVPKGARSAALTHRIQGRTRTRTPGPSSWSPPPGPRPPVSP